MSRQRRLPRRVPLSIQLKSDLCKPGFFILISKSGVL